MQRSSDSPKDPAGDVYRRPDPNSYQKTWTAADFTGDIARFADVVMKGGVTSGVVYPAAICRLATRFSLKNIGGTSVGAIAAAVAAAAEYRRRCGGATPDGAGYQKLSELPAFLSRPGTLQALFAADDRARSLLAIALCFVGQGSLEAKVLRALPAALRAFAWVPLAAFAITFALFALVALPVDPWAWVRVGIATLPIGAILSLAGLALRFLLHTIGTLDANQFGWCHGVDAHELRAFAAFAAGKSPTTLTAAETPPLIDWLDALIADAAGLPPKHLLTFGDLWNAPSPAFYQRPASDTRSIDFRMITTCVTLGRPFEIPFSPDEIPLYFLADELEKFFPPHVMEHLKRKAIPWAQDTRYLRFPAAADIPLVVAARFSMSFPVLFCAVPLHAVDVRGQMQTVWFSDGGLSSNFPIHLFDGPLPRWPTFGIDLVGGNPDVKGNLPPQYAVDVAFMEDSIAIGNVNPWTSTAGRGSRQNVAAFFLAIINTMQTWQDTTLGTLPGNSTRTVGLRLSEDEGGLNLNMPQSKIEGLINLGDAAGGLLSDNFGALPDTDGWRAHRWTRYRATMAAASRWFGAFQRGFARFTDASQQATYRELISARVPAGLDAEVLAATTEVADELADWPPGVRTFIEDNEPVPIASLHMRPDFKH